MKKISDTYYDETGLCPVCGEGLVPVMIYSGKVLNTHVSTRVQDINTKVRTTTKTYTDIKPLYVGWCLACAKRAHETKQEQQAAELAAQQAAQIIHGLLSQLIGSRNEKQQPSAGLLKGGQHVKPLAVVQAIGRIHALFARGQSQFLKLLQFQKRRKQIIALLFFRGFLRHLHHSFN